MILASGSAVLSQYTRVTDDDDRLHLIPIGELAMQLQRCTKNETGSISCNVMQQITYSMICYGIIRLREVCKKLQNRKHHQDVYLMRERSYCCIQKSTPTKS